MFKEKPKAVNPPKFGDLHYGVFSEDRLAEFNGVTEENLYLAVLGSVFNVSKGAKYYAKGGSYNYFVGKLVHIYILSAMLYCLNGTLGS